MALITVICSFVVVALGWSYFGRIDILAVAPGKIRPSSLVKVIQPLETGKVIILEAKNGMHVKAGSILVEVEPAEAIADEADMASAYESYKAEALRRNAAIGAAKSAELSSPSAIVWPEDVSSSVRSREQEVLNDDLAQLAAQLRSLDAQLAEKQAEKVGLEATIESQAALVATMQERVSMRQTLLDRGAEARSSVIDALETMEYHRTSLMTLKEQLAEAVANMRVLVLERQKTISTFISDNSQRYAQAAQERDDYEQKLIKTRIRRQHMILASPVSGTITALSITTLGQVITTGQEVMRIVPDDSHLEIECYLQNRDIGFVHAGQIAQVKVESFPFTRYGTISARVTNVASDTIQSLKPKPVKATQ
ncbi:HlyD family type I secretion periplasmic adaptor subunit [Methylovirgula ligni]|uniref:HlyD family type I secretion periplasmic adaptor subunit n=1 Tax=Methylovirgula ligni TaxID=569860 RepID=UPI001FE1D4B0|nr:HlyD family type I secretion periplasmic adaptor subunit [Methylovirgula ligni]